MMTTPKSWTILDESYSEPTPRNSLRPERCSWEAWILIERDDGSLFYLMSQRHRWSTEYCDEPWCETEEVAA